MFSNASNFVYGVDLTFAIILGASVVLLITITAVMIWFVFRYRRQRNPVASQLHGNDRLEIVWTVIPTILVLVMFYYGWAGYQPMRDIPEDAIPVVAHAQMWQWNFEYANGKTTDTLVVPVGKAVKIDLNSRDVVHSLYIPAFRIKEDVVPGRTNRMWFIANEVDDYHIFCAEYCGDRHSNMLSKVVVLPEDEFTKWVNDTTSLSSMHPGLALLKKNACITCHSLEGIKIVGPSFRGLFGKSETVITSDKEREVVVDEAYIKHSLTDPNADVVKGFNKGLMISYKEILSEQDIKDIIEYLKTLK
ncbi:MAG: cytochrome c oxidase subunit II [Bacteroidetes bacterium]|nr:cytochrome c oxidase subunit II [Bacteroidota bacterium]